MKNECEFAKQRERQWEWGEVRVFQIEGACQVWSGEQLGSEPWV